MNALILAKMQTFEPDSLKTSGDIAPQNQRILQTIISSVALNVSPLNLVRFLILRRSFSSDNGFSLTELVKKLKKKWKGSISSLLGPKNAHSLLLLTNTKETQGLRLLR